MADEMQQEQNQEAMPKTSEELLKYFLGPIIMLIFAVVIIFVAVLPQLDQISQSIQEISEFQAEYDELKQKEQRLQSLVEQQQEQQQLLDLVERIIPQSRTQVVEFGEEIKQKIEGNNLILRDSVIRETIVVDATEDSENSVRIELVQLPSEFTIEGEFDDIRRFFGDLYADDDFITIENMDLTKKLGASASNNSVQFSTDNVDVWSMPLTLTKYQFRVRGLEDDAQLESYYFNVSENVRPDQEVLDFIQERYLEETEADAQTEATQ